MGDREVLTPPNVLNMPNGTFVIGKGDPVGIAIGKEEAVAFEIGKIQDVASDCNTHPFFWLAVR